LQLVSDLFSLPLIVTPSSQLLESALEIAIETGRSVYDSLYLALAVAHKCPMITADKRLVNALSRGPLSGVARSLS
jgi:predicted nucleic acid-binding protein